MVSVAWHGVEGENENRFIIYLNFWYVDFPLTLYKKKITKKKSFSQIMDIYPSSAAELSRIINVINIS